MTENNRIYQLLLNDLTSDISEEEKEILEDEMSADSETGAKIQIIRDYWHYCFPKSQQNQIIQKTEKKLGFASSSKSRINNNIFYKIAAGLLLLISLSYMGYDYFRPATEVSLNKYITNPGQVKNIVLSDGTKVWLNAQSVLIVAEPFLNNTREVMLVGEGYFEVAPNPEKPFVVKTQKLKTKVLGTHFNISAYIDDNKHEVRLYEGKVELAPLDSPGNKMLIKPGEKVIYNRENNGFEIYVTDLGEPAAWRDGVIRFYDEDLYSIAKVLERRFNTKILVADDQIGKLHFTANFDEEPLDKIFELLKEAHDFKFIKLKDSIIIQSGKNNI